MPLSKITHLTLVKIFPPFIIDQLNKTHKNFIWKELNPKIKISTINNNYKNGGLKNFKMLICSHQISWIKRLYDESFHDWKILENEKSLDFILT